MNRRAFLQMIFSAPLLLALGGLLRPATARAQEAIGLTRRSDAEWKRLLTPQQYDILREEGTERPFTSPLLREHRVGIFACVACGLPLFPSQYKYESGTGWPSFYDVLPGHVLTKPDYLLPAARTEYHCARCGGHQGHIFNDGPKPTGLRYCNNGAALKFVPQSDA
jgi:peptide-methionine (R)-S-oxide reductase